MTAKENSCELLRYLPNLELGRKWLFMSQSSRGGIFTVEGKFLNSESATLFSLKIEYPKIQYLTLDSKDASPGGLAHKQSFLSNF